MAKKVLNPAGLSFPDSREQCMEMVSKGIECHMDAFKDQIRDGEEVNS